MSFFNLNALSSPILIKIHFIDMPARIKVRGQEIHVHYPLRAHSPVLRSAGIEKWAPPISWLGNRRLRYHWG